MKPEDNAMMLIGVLGVNPETFLEGVKKAKRDVLIEALELVSKPDQGDTPEWIIKKAGYGATIIQEELKRRTRN